MDTAFFLASKLIWMLIRPETWAVLGLGFGMVALWRGRLCAAKRWLGGVMGALLVIGFLPLGDLVIAALEPDPPAPLTAPITGIIILGGAEEPVLSAARGVPVLNDGAERLLTGLALARAHPEARLIYTSGSGDPRNQDKPGATVAAQVFGAAGLARGRFEVEAVSRTTWENARLTHDMVAPKPGETWVLVTSAFHMRRAQGAFCAAGWAVVPYPTDYRSGAFGARIGWNLSEHLSALNTGVKEWVGLAAYRATGRWRDPDECPLR